MAQNKLTVVDLFSGCGGMSLGFEMAGFQTVLAVDIWQDALDTFKFNHKDVDVLCADLSTISALDVKNKFKINEVDVIIGGPPCQGFSIAGKRIIDDTRNKLYKSFVDFVEFFSPKAFVMENVPNILSIGEGKIKDSIIDDFARLGYNVSIQIVLASNYGVPQNRRRAVFVGLKNNVYDFPVANGFDLVTSYDAISDLPECSIEDGLPHPISPRSSYQVEMRKDCDGLFNHQTTNHNEQTVEIISMVPDGGNYKDLPKELWETRKVNIAWTRLNSHKPSFTIDTGHNHHFHYAFNRVPTSRESARLQSFPDHYIFLKGKTSQLKQIGNAVPPLMAKAIALKLLGYLK